MNYKELLKMSGWTAPTVNVVFSKFSEESMKNYINTYNILCAETVALGNNLTENDFELVQILANKGERACACMLAMGSIREPIKKQLNPKELIEMWNSIRKGHFLDF